MNPANTPDTPGTYSMSVAAADEFDVNADGVHAAIRALDRAIAELVDQFGMLEDQLHTICRDGVPQEAHAFDSPDRSMSVTTAQILALRDAIEARSVAVRNLRTRIDL